jgi:hypothetical protein
MISEVALFILLAAVAYPLGIWLFAKVIVQPAAESLDSLLAPPTEESATERARRWAPADAAELRCGLNPVGEVFAEWREGKLTYRVRAVTLSGGSRSYVERLSIVVLDSRGDAVGRMVVPPGANEGGTVAKALSELRAELDPSRQSARQ